MWVGLHVCLTAPSNKKQNKVAENMKVRVRIVYKWTG